MARIVPLRCSVPGESRTNGKLACSGSSYRDALMMRCQPLRPDGAEASWPVAPAGKANPIGSLAPSRLGRIYVLRMSGSDLPARCPTWRLPTHVVFKILTRLPGLIVVCFGGFGAVVSRSQMRGTWGTISLEEHTSMAPRPHRQSQNPPLQESSAIPALPWPSKPPLRYSPGLIPTTRLNALLKAAPDS
jgi:hypothetical protein